MRQSFRHNYLLVVIVLSIISLIVVISFINIDNILKFLSKNRVIRSNTITVSVADLGHEISKNEATITVTANRENSIKYGSLDTTEYWKSVFYEDRQTDKSGKIIMTKQVKVSSIQISKNKNMVSRVIGLSNEQKEIIVNIDDSTRISFPVYKISSKNNQIVGIDITRIDKESLKTLVPGNILVVRGKLNHKGDTYDIQASEIVLANIINTN